MSAATVPAVRGTAVGSHDGPGADPTWLELCLDVFGLIPYTIAVERASAPLTLIGGRLELVGTSILFEPSDFTWAHDDALDELAAAIAAERLPLSLTRLPAASAAIPALRRHMPLVIERPAGSCPVLRIDRDVDEVLPGRLRQDLRRARRRAERDSTVAVSVHEPGVADVDGLLDVAFAVEEQSWKGRAGTALALDAGRARFYRAYCRAAAAAGTLRIALLQLDDAPAAMQIAIERAEALWLLKIGYDERYKFCSPGQLLMEATVRWAAERGLERYEFLGTAAAWTRQWTRDEWACSWVLAYPFSPRGAVAVVHDGARLGRKLVRR